MGNVEKKDIGKTPEWMKKGEEKNNKNKNGIDRELLWLRAEIVSDIEKKEANELVNNIPGTKKDKISEKMTAKVDIKKTVEKLNRPEATEGLIQAYQNMETTIKNSPDDKNLIARASGKVMNRILKA